MIPLSIRNNCQDFQIDPCQCAYVHISGAVNNVNKESATFKLDVEHYISAFRDLNDSNSKPTGIKPIAPFTCGFSSRYQNRKKPVPFDRRYVSISGFLTDVTYKPNSELDIVERFMVSIDHIAFLGQQSTIPNTLDSKYYLPAQFSGLIDFPLAPVKTPHRGKSLIDYKRGRPSTPITTTIISPTTPATPTPPSVAAGPARGRGPSGRATILGELSH